MTAQPDSDMNPNTLSLIFSACIPVACFPKKTPGRQRIAAFIRIGLFENRIFLTTDSSAAGITKARRREKKEDSGKNEGAEASVAGPGLVYSIGTEVV